MLRALLFVLLLLPPVAVSAQSGQRSFYPVQLVLTCPDDPAGAPARLDYDEGGCVAQRIDGIDPQRRAIWVRARVTIPDGAAATLGVYVSAMASSQAYWNGRLIGANGAPAAVAADERPGLMDADFHLPKALITPGENLLALRLSGHAIPIRVERPVHLIGVGPFGALRSALLRNYLPALAASGAILLAGMFFLAAFVLDREASALWLSLTALFAVCQLGAEAARGLIAYDYPAHLPRLMTVYACACLFAVALSGFIATRFHVRGARLWIASTVLAIAVSLIAPGFDSRTLLAVLAGACMGLAALATAAWNGQPGARLTAAALFCFIALIVFRPGAFLDRDFYLGVSGLMGVLFVDQLFAMRRDRAAREAAERRSARFELELLRRSIGPHFMMNTLNSLAEWVESNPARGVRMIEALGNQMRALAAHGERDAIPLAEEIELVENYLAVMSFRADASFSLIVNGETTAIRTPPGILHTLAENGFSHNRYADGGEFRLHVESVGDRTRLVFETPASAQRRARAEGGEGGAYVRGRLAAAYGEAAHFSDGPADEGRWRSVVDMPAVAP